MKNQELLFRGSVRVSGCEGNWERVWGVRKARRGEDMKKKKGRTGTAIQRTTKTVEGIGRGSRGEQGKRKEGREEGEGRKEGRRRKERKEKKEENRS